MRLPIAEVFNFAKTECGSGSQVEGKEGGRHGFADFPVPPYSVNMSYPDAMGVGWDAV